MNSNSSIAVSEDSSFPSRNDFLKIFFLAVAYFLAHGISFFFPDTQKVIMLVWPAGGVGLAAFLLNRKKIWPALAIAFFISGILADMILAGRSFTTGIGFMTGNMVESIGCAFLILNWSKDFQRFNRINEVLALIGGVIIINGISSCIGAGTSVIESGASFGDSWLSWYIADGIGVLLVGPLLVSWSNVSRISRDEITFLKIIEVLAILVIWTAITILTFYKPSFILPISIHPYFIVALIAWPATRFGIRGVTITLVILLILAIFSGSIISGPSPFPGISTDYTQRVLELQMFIAFTAFVGYLVAAGYDTMVSSEMKLKEILFQLNEKTFLLTETKNELNIILENTPLGISKIIDRKQVLVNKKTEELFQYPREELLYQSTRKLYPSDEAYEKLGKEAYPILAAGQVFETVQDLIRKDGSHLKIKYSGQALNPSDMSKGVIWLLEDITEHLKIEEKLRQSEEQFRLLFENSVDAIVIGNPDGTIYSANPQACKIFDRTEEELKNVGRQGTVDQTDVRLPRLIEDRKRTGKFKGEINYVRKDGTIFPVELSVAEFKDSSGNERSVIISRDISERKKTEKLILESEKKLKLAQKYAHIGSWTWHIKTNRLEWSDEMYHLFGIDKENFTGSLPDVIAKAIHPDDREKVAESNTDVMKYGQPTPLDYRIILPDGSLRTVWAEAGDLILDENGNPDQLSGFAQDISERKKSENEIKKQLIELETFNRVMVGRELKMVELKKGINSLLERLGESKRYTL